MVKLEDLNIFDLLKLSHLSDEDKARRIADLQEFVLLDFFMDDLPKLVSGEKLEEFKALGDDSSRQAEVESWLRSNVGGFDELLKEKMLAAKKALVRENMITRLDINRQEIEEGAGEQRREELTQEKETLEKIISAINSDSWDEASNLIATL